MMPRPDRGVQLDLGHCVVSGQVGLARGYATAATLPLEQVPTVSKPSRSKIPLVLVMAGALCFALGWRMIGIILTGVGGLLFAMRSSSGGDSSASGQS